MPAKKSSHPLRITNARENNLKNVTLELEHDSYVTVTGLSGSGKSSFAFDTVYAEGQRRYIETFSPYTRQFFDKVKRPQVDSIENVRPAVAIQQRTRVVNSRSTVGTMTDINDYLKVVWSNVAVPVCGECGIEFIGWDKKRISAVLERWCSLRAHSTFLLCVELTFSSNQKAFITALESLKAQGFNRYFSYESGEVRDIDDELPPLKRGSTTTHSFVLARCKQGSFNKKDIEDNLEQAFTLGEGRVLIIESISSTSSLRPIHNSGSLHIREHRFSREAGCPVRGTKIEQARPALFSFNHPIGACPECKGFGKILVMDRSRVISDLSKSLEGGVIEIWNGPSAASERKRLLAFCKENGVPTKLPWRDLSTAQQELVFNHKSKKYVGVKAWFEWLETKKYKMHVRVFLARYRGQANCPTCLGTRLKQDSIAYKIGGKSIHDIWNMPISDLKIWFLDLQKNLIRTKKLPRQLKDVFANVESRLNFLSDLGLGYLTLDRQARTLSGGETQRVNLATALGSNLISTHFVLDEPSVGLHARDTERLIGALAQLHERGNSLLVVEHDPDCIVAGDTVLELGPQAGEHGGEVTYLGPTAEWAGVKMQAFTPRKESPPRTPALTIRNASARNVRNVSTSIPLNAFVCLTGVSGSGKSTLAHEIIKAGFDVFRGLTERSHGVEFEIQGFEHLEDVVFIDQSALAKSPRANIATYTKIWDVVRDYLSATEEAKSRALTKSAFSFNVNAGRCTACEGAGFIREDMQFLSDVFVPCEECLGRRFQQLVLDVNYKGKNVDDLLRMSVDACMDFFSHNSHISEAAMLLSKLGLGHLTLGHSLSELSGGEAQRLKLVPFIQSSRHGKALLIFDEPTTGLHIRDVEHLLEVFHLLRERGHTVLCVEHNLRLIAEADWIIDLGPEGGFDGGKIVQEGTPYDFIKNPKTSHTATYLAEFCERYGKAKLQKKKTARVRPYKAPAKEIVINGAREHNLKEISLKVPLEKFVTFTGVSGSGKSTIAKDIIYAEGQRRYLDCLSPYARQFIKELRKPDLDDIKNVKPTICVYQHTFQPTSLSTVGTMSEAYNFMRLLYAKLGIQHCPDHPDQSITALGADAIAARVKENFSGNIRMLAPIIKLKKGNHRAVLERAIASEISEVRVDGIFGSPSKWLPEGLTKSKSHTIEFVVARCNVKTLALDLLQEGVAQGLVLGGGNLVVIGADQEEVFSSERTCPICQRGFFKPDPEDLSFHSKRGRCTACHGQGVDKKGLVCKVCQGTRLNELGRNIRLAHHSIDQLSAKSAPALLAFLNDISWSKREAAIAQPIMKELHGKLATLIDLGLDAVRLGRDCSTLSGGELQRLRLATAIGSPLTGVLYIFDEPSAGLHPIDNRRVLKKLRDLRDKGNSVLQIEHEADSILASDYIIEVGPGAGREGGRITFNGTINEFLVSNTSVTSSALSSKTAPQSGILHTASLTLRKGTCNNIRGLNLSIPLKHLVSIVGVSGAGKSSLVHGILVETIVNGKGGGDSWRSENGQISAEIPVERLLVVDQQPIGINSRSTPISYLGAWDEIRDLFAKIPESEARGWSKSFFSYNTGKGRCQSCKGMGEVTLEMSFLAEARVPCEACSGSRFSPEAQSIKYLGLSVSDILKLTFEEARAVFVNHKRIHRVLKTACDLGLGYLVLGQSSSTLSGGESQRIKLTSELNADRRGHTIYVLDEPTTGLHKLDVAKLLDALHALVAKGHSVIVIEHDLDLIAASDYVIELGPGSGDDGGKVVYVGAADGMSSAPTAWGGVLREKASSAQMEVANN